MNPWRIDVFEVCRRVLRTTLWLCFMIVGLMAGIFFVRFSFSFFCHLWTLCRRVMFSDSW